MMVAVDHLVNNAGINSVCMFEDTTDITLFRTIMVIHTHL
jgi:short-subunit dehydrogenase